MQNNSPSLLALVRWLTSITKEVHAPLLASTVFRLITQSLDIAIFAVAGWSIATALTDRLRPLGFLLIVGLALLRALTHYLEQFAGHYVAFKALELLRGHVFSQLWPKAPGVVLQQHSGSLLASLTKDVDRIEVVYAHTFAPLISAFFVPALALSIAGFYCGFAIIAIPLFCVLISVLLVPVIGFKKSLAATEATLATRADLTAQITDSVHGIKEVLVYGRQAERSRSMAKQDDTVLASSLPGARAKALRRSLNLLLNLISVLSVITISLSTDIDPIWAISLTLGATRLFEAPKGIESAVGYLDHSFSAACRLWALCHAPQQVQDGVQELSIAQPPSIEWKKVTYHYPTTPATKLALDRVSFTAAAGKRTVLVGASGSGKSTAVQLLLRFDELDSGQILIAGSPITNYTLESLRRTVVLVSQKSQVLTGTIADNLKLGAPQADETQLWQVLEVACLADEIRAMPNALETQVGTGGSELSGGQLQRLALARALLVEPKVLILDEFTANLNTDLEKEIRGRLTASYPGLTMLEVTHRLENLQGAHAVYRFEKGRIIGQEIQGES